MHFGCAGKVLTVPSDCFDLLPVHTEPLLPHFLFLYVGLFTFTNLLPQVLKLNLSIASRKFQLFSRESAPPDSSGAAWSIHCHLHPLVPAHHHHCCSCNLADWLCPLPAPPLASSRRRYSFHLCKQRGCLSEPTARVMNFWEFQ